MTSTACFSFDIFLQTRQRQCCTISSNLGLHTYRANETVCPHYYKTQKETYRLLNNSN